MSPLETDPSRKIKVLYLTPGCFDKGGISRYSRYQINALRELVGQRNVSVFSVLGPGDDSFEDAFDVSYFAGGISPVDKARFLFHSFRAGMTEKPDLIVAAHVNLSGPARVMARLWDARSVLNVYGREVWSGLRHDSRWGFAGVHSVLSDCNFTARYIEAEGMRPRGTTSVVWDCVDLTKFFPRAASRETLVKYGIPDPATGKNLLTLGRMSPNARHKGYERLLQAFSRVATKVPDLRLIYAGRGDLVDQLRGEAKALGLGDRVFFTGMVHEDDMADVYRSAHIFSLVSHRAHGAGEGIPLTPLEAAACGTPILVGNQDGSQEAVMGDENGFVLEPFDIDAHASKIELLATDEPRRAAMGRAAVAIAVKEFSYEGFREKHRVLLPKWLGAGSG